MSDTNGTPPLRILLLDSPRTCSQVFRRLFHNHSQLGHMMHLYASPHVYGPDRIQRRLKHNPAAEDAHYAWAKAQPERATETYETFEKTVHDIEGSGKIPFMKEHIVTLIQQDILIEGVRTSKADIPPTSNPTYIPDQLLLSFSPVFLIRHPAQMVPCHYRIMSNLAKLQVEDEDFIVLTSQRWTRVLWDYFTAHPPARKPVLINAEDVMYNTEAITSKLWGILGIDPSGVEYSWDAVPREHWPDDELEIAWTFIGELLASNGVAKAEKPKGPINVDAEMQKWKKQYVEDVAKALRKRVDEEMADYEYLRHFKLTL